MIEVLVKTVEPSETVERLVPMALAYALLTRGGFDRVQIIDPETRIVIFSS